MIKLAVIGDPIEHSLSPAVHSGALDALNIEYTYEKVRVQKGGLEEFLDYAIKSGITGFNLTMPHKVDILPYLYEIDEEAERFQSVNTVRIENNRLYGYNTDSEGYNQALKMKGRSFKDSNVLILGAGGVVRTLALKAAWEGAKQITLLNRTLSKAEEIAESVKEKTGADIKGGEMSLDTIVKECGDCDILINATPLGMSGIAEDFEDLSFLDALPKAALVSDLIYNPAETRLLKAAKAVGLDTLNGLGMLIYQGLLADRIYIKQDFDMEKIYKKVEKRLNE